MIIHIVYVIRMSEKDCGEKKVIDLFRVYIKKTF